MLILFITCLAPACSDTGVSVTVGSRQVELLALLPEVTESGTEDALSHLRSPQHQHCASGTIMTVPHTPPLDFHILIAISNKVSSEERICFVSNDSIFNP